MVQQSQAGRKIVFNSAFGFFNLGIVRRLRIVLASLCGRLLVVYFLQEFSSSKRSSISGRLMGKARFPGVAQALGSVFVMDALWTT